MPLRFLLCRLLDPSRKLTEISARVRAAQYKGTGRSF